MCKWIRVHSAPNMPTFLFHRKSNIFAWQRQTSLNFVKKKKKNASIKPEKLVFDFILGVIVFNANSGHRNAIWFCFKSLCIVVLLRGDLWHINKYNSLSQSPDLATHARALQEQKAELEKEIVNLKKRLEDESKVICFLWVCQHILKVSFLSTNTSTTLPCQLYLGPCLVC